MIDNNVKILKHKIGGARLVCPLIYREQPVVSEAEAAWDVSLSSTRFENMLMASVPSISCRPEI